jgi:hypothetical protein
MAKRSYSNTKVNMAAFTSIKKLICILRGDQKVGMNNTGPPKSLYKYYRVIKKLICILRGEPKVGMNITGQPKSWYKYYRVIKKLV